MDTRKAALQQQDQAMAGLADFDLPRTVVTRLARSQVGDQAKLSPDVISALIKSSTVFINYLAAAAQENATTQSRKTLSYKDIYEAVEVIQYGGSDEGVRGVREVLRKEVDAWDEIQSKLKSKSTAAGGTSGETGSNSSASRGGRVGGRGRGRGRGGKAGGREGVEVDGEDEPEEEEEVLVVGNGAGDQEVEDEDEEEEENDEQEDEEDEGDDGDDGAEDQQTISVNPKGSAVTHHVGNDDVVMASDRED